MDNLPGFFYPFPSWCWLWWPNSWCTLYKSATPLLVGWHHLWAAPSHSLDALRTAKMNSKREPKSTVLITQKHISWLNLIHIICPLNSHKGSFIIDDTRRPSEAGQAKASPQPWKRDPGKLCAHILDLNFARIIYHLCVLILSNRHQKKNCYILMIGVF